MGGRWFSLAPVAAVAEVEEETPAPTPAGWEAGVQVALWNAVAARRMALQVRL